MTDRRPGSEVHPIEEIIGRLVRVSRDCAPDEEPPSECPDGYREIQARMSNYDHHIDPEMDEALRGGDVYGRHSGWNFNGLVWFDAESGEFKEEVWHYHVPQRVYSAATLEDLMEAVNEDWGWD